MKKHIVLGCIILLVLLCGVGNARLLPQSISDLTIGSDVIIYGKIIDVQSQWNAEKTHIETNAQVLVNDTFKSSDNTSINSGSIITVTVLGGTVGNKTESVEDIPYLIKDADAIIFLKKSSSGKYSVLHLFGVTDGKIGVPLDVKSPELANDVATFKQQITDIMQGKVSNLTRPGILVPTTQKAPILFAPFIAVIAIILISRKMLR
jgi:hypothetical protein